MGGVVSPILDGAVSPILEGAVTPIADAIVLPLLNGTIIPIVAPLAPILDGVGGITIGGPDLINVDLNATLLGTFDLQFLKLSALLTVLRFRPCRYAGFKLDGNSPADPRSSFAGCGPGAVIGVQAAILVPGLLRICLCVNILPNGGQDPRACPTARCFALERESAADKLAFTSALLTRSRSVAVKMDVGASARLDSLAEGMASASGLRHRLLCLRLPR